MKSCHLSYFQSFLSDIEMHLGQNIQSGITLGQLQLYLLLFADDAVLVSETPEGLQRSLDNLHDYCNKWNLKVNIDFDKYRHRAQAASA